MEEDEEEEGDGRKKVAAVRDREPKKKIEFQLNWRRTFTAGAVMSEAPANPLSPPANSKSRLGCKSGWIGIDGLPGAF